MNESSLQQITFAILNSFKKYIFYGNPKPKGTRPLSSHHVAAFIIFHIQREMLIFEACCNLKQGIN